MKFIDTLDLGFKVQNYSVQKDMLKKMYIDSDMEVFKHCDLEIDDEILKKCLGFITKDMCDSFEIKTFAQYLEFDVEKILYGSSVTMFKFFVDNNLKGIADIYKQFVIDGICYHYLFYNSYKPLLYRNEEDYNLDNHIKKLVEIRVKQYITAIANNNEYGIIQGQKDLFGIAFKRRTITIENIKKIDIDKIIAVEQWITIDMIMKYVEEKFKNNNIKFTDIYTNLFEDDKEVNEIIEWYIKYKIILTYCSKKILKVEKEGEYAIITSLKDKPQRSVKIKLDNRRIRRENWDIKKTIPIDTLIINNLNYTPTYIHNKSNYIRKTGNDYYYKGRYKSYNITYNTDYHYIIIEVPNIYIENKTPYEIIYNAKNALIEFLEVDDSQLELSGLNRIDIKCDYMMKDKEEERIIEYICRNGLRDKFYSLEKNENLKVKYTGYKKSFLIKYRKDGSGYREFASYNKGYERYSRYLDGKISQAEYVKYKDIYRTECRIKNKKLNADNRRKNSKNLYTYTEDYIMEEYTRDISKIYGKQDFYELNYAINIIKKSKSLKDKEKKICIELLKKVNRFGTTKGKKKFCELHSEPTFRKYKEKIEELGINIITYPQIIEKELTVHKVIKNFALLENSIEI